MCNGTAALQLYVGLVCVTPQERPSDVPAAAMSDDDDEFDWTRPQDPPTAAPDLPPRPVDEADRWAPVMDISALISPVIPDWPRPPRRISGVRRGNRKK